MEKGELRAAIALTTALLIGSSACGGIDVPQDGSHAERTTTTATHEGSPSTTAVNSEDCDTWEMTGLDHEGHRVIAEGVPSIGTASNESESRGAVADWLDLAKRDAGVLKGVAKTIAEEDVSTSDLKDSDDCATDLAVDIVGEIEGDLASADMKPADVPTDAVNSGVNDDGEFVQADHEGISGDRRSIEVTINDIKIWIMKRCGNIGKRGHIPGVPKGPTDEMSQKNDSNTTPAGVPGANGGSQTSDSGSKGPGKGTSSPNSQGSSAGEEVINPPAEQSTNTDTDSSTGNVDNGGTSNGSDTTDEDINHGTDGSQGGTLDGGGL